MPVRALVVNLYSLSFSFVLLLFVNLAHAKYILPERSSGEEYMSWLNLIWRKGPKRFLLVCEPV